MFEVVRDHVIRQGMLVWLVAGGKEAWAKPARPKTTKFFTALWTSRHAIVLGRPDAQGSTRAGVLPDACSIWWNRETAPELIGLEAKEWKETDLFYDEKPFFQHVAAFVASGEYARFLAAPKPLVDIVQDKALLKWVEDELGVDTKTPVCLTGLTCCGINAGAVYLGCRTDVELERRLQLGYASSEWCALRLQEPVPVPLRAAAHAQEWWRHVRDFQMPHGEAFVAYCRELLQAATAGAVASAGGGDVLTMAVDDVPAGTRVVYVPPEAVTPQGLAAALHGISPVAGGAGVLLWVGTSAGDARSVLYEKDVLSALRGGRVFVLGIEELAHLSSSYPWVWSKHAGHEGFDIVYRDDAFLRRSLRLLDTPAAIMQVAEEVRHPGAAACERGVALVGHQRALGGRQDHGGLAAVA